MKSIIALIQSDLRDAAVCRVCIRSDRTVPACSGLPYIWIPELVRVSALRKILLADNGIILELHIIPAVSNSYILSLYKAMLRIRLVFCASCIHQKMLSVHRCNS